MSADLPRPPGLLAKLALLGGSLLLCILCLLVAEGLCRAFCDLPYLGSSRNLFVPRVYGPSKGNAREVQAVSYGVAVHTDANGFRIPRDPTVDAPANAPALLILGDSVGFGPGVAEEQTLAGRLRENLPEIRIYNASVIGYNTYDYENFVAAFLPERDEIERAYLVLCLNDVRAQSAKQIDEALRGSAGETRPSPSLARRVNDYLRPRSKLYLLVKDVIRQPQTRTWELVSSSYQDPDFPLRDKMQPVVEVARTFEERGIPFTVVLSPFAYQVGHTDEAAELPQRKLMRILDEERIDHIDALPAFRASALPDRRLFLGGDAMHLSAEGHAVIADVILRDL